MYFECDNEGEQEMKTFVIVVMILALLKMVARVIIPLEWREYPRHTNVSRWADIGTLLLNTIIFTWGTLLVVEL